MQAFRLAKRNNLLLRSVQGQSRQIISNIYNINPQEQKLQLNQGEWPTIHIQHVKQIKAEKSLSLQPTRYLLPLLRKLAQGLILNICGFIFIENGSFSIVYLEKTIQIKKARLNTSKLKYWLSHIYFFRFREKLARNALEQSESRIIVHENQQKQYIPSILRGPDGQKSLILQMKISTQSCYRKNQQSQKQPFCVAYFKNDTQQLFSFSQFLAFVDYRFDLNQIMFIKILPKLIENGPSQLVTKYLPNEIKEQQKKILHQFRKVYERLQKWKVIENKLDQKKLMLLNKKEYQAYAQLMTLQIISFLQHNQPITVKQLKLEWIVDVECNVVISNTFIYDYAHSYLSNNTEGLATLYQKLQHIQSPRRNIYKSRRMEKIKVKKIKSEEKYKGKSQQKLPLLNWNNSKKRSTSNSLQILNKIKEQ